MNRPSYPRPLVFGLVTSLALGATAGGARANVTRASIRAAATQSDGASRTSPAVVSADGRFVAFASDATNLAPSDTNAVTDVFVRDRTGAVTERVSLATGGGQASGASSTPSISADGRFVAFASVATNLVVGDSNARTDVFVKDRQTGVTDRVSVATGFFQASGHSVEPRISGDGRFVAFRSDATDLVAGDTNGQPDVFVHDRQTTTTTRVSVATNGTEGNGPCFGLAISADGRYVAFVSRANNLVANDTNGFAEVFVRDRQTNTTTRVSVTTAGAQGDAPSVTPAISGDGRYVVFESGATNLVAGDTNGASDVFLRDRTAATTTRVSLTSAGAQATGASTQAAISGDGRHVVFRSTAANLVASDTNGVPDVFIRDRTGGATWRASITSAGVQAGAASDQPAISADAKTVAFTSTATNLVAGDTNAVSDAFVWNPDPVAITGLHCESGTGNILCDVFYDNGWGAVDTRWTFNGNHDAAFDGDEHILRRCVNGTWYQVQVTVSDQIPSSASRSTAIQCRAIWQ